MMTRQNLNTVAKVFGVCFLLSVGMQLFSLAVYVAVPDLMLGENSPLQSLFGPLSPEQIRLSFYGFLTLMKILGLTLFLTPWLGLKIVARGLPE